MLVQLLRRKVYPEREETIAKIVKPDLKCNGTHERELTRGREKISRERDWQTMISSSLPAPLGGRLCVTSLIGSEEEEETISTIFIVLESDRNILEV